MSRNSLLLVLALAVAGGMMLYSPSKPTQKKSTKNTWEEIRNPSELSELGGAFQKILDAEAKRVARGVDAPEDGAPDLLKEILEKNKGDVQLAIAEVRMRLERANPSDFKTRFQLIALLPRLQDSDVPLDAICFAEIVKEIKDVPQAGYPTKAHQEFIIATFEVYKKLQPHGEQALNAVLTIYSKHTDPQFRNALVQSFVSRFPELQGALSQRIRELRL